MTDSYAYDELLMLQGIRDWKAEERKNAQAKVEEDARSKAPAIAVVPRTASIPVERKPPQRVPVGCIVSPVLRGKVEAVITVVCSAYGLSREGLLSRCQHQELTHARSIAAWLLRDWTSMSLPQIGKTLNRHHTSILQAIDRTKQRMIDDPMYAQRVVAMRNAAMAMLGVRVAA